MSVIFKKYAPEPLFGEDYYKMRDFLIKLDSHNYHFGRWDWMITHGYLDKSGLSKIGLWEEDSAVVAAATYDCSLGKAFLLTLPARENLKEEILLYAKENLQKDGEFQVIIRDGDLQMQDIAMRLGFYPTQRKECDAIYPIGEKKVEYKLPDGFSIVSLHEDPNTYEVGRIMWNGFNHELNGEGVYSPSEDDLKSIESQLLRPNVNLSTKIAVVAPDGHYASFCGTWQDNASESALVEPVATDPAYRKMGLGRAAVLEAIHRCGKLGAKRAFVGSSQQFYYSIGFRPYATSTWWEQK